ncbi:MAG: hypothetical protein AAF928_21285, partial [Myxococcota bacterium]
MAATAYRRAGAGAAGDDAVGAEADVDGLGASRADVAPAGAAAAADGGAAARAATLVLAGTA